MPRRQAVSATRMRWVLLLAALIPGCALFSQEEELSLETNEGLMQAKGIHIDSIPKSPGPRRMAVLIAFSSDMDYGGDRILLRSALAPRETLQLNLHDTSTGEFVYQGVEFAVSDPSVAQVTEDGLLTGLKDGETVVCARRDGLEACRPFAVGGGVLDQYFTSETSNSNAATLYALDGAPAMNGASPLFHVSSGPQLEPVGVSQDGRWIVDFAGRTAWDLVSGNTHSIPQPSVDGNAYFDPISGGDTLYLVRTATHADTGYVYLSEVAAGKAAASAPRLLYQTAPMVAIAGYAFAPDASSMLVVEKQAVGGDGSARFVMVEVIGGDVAYVLQDLFDASHVLFSDNGKRLLASGATTTFDRQAHPGKDNRLLVVIERDGDSWAEVSRFPFPSSAQPELARDGSFVAASDDEATVVLSLAEGSVTSLPPGGHVTPWNSVHVALYDQELSGITPWAGFVQPLDAFELFPATGTLASSRVFHPLHSGPSGRSLLLASLYSPVGGLLPEASSLRWTSASGLAPPGPQSVAPCAMFDPADDPGAFLAIATPAGAVPSDAPEQAPTVGLELLSLNDLRSRVVVPGSDVSFFDVSHTGLLFMITAPYGHLLVSDPAMHRLSVLAIGVTGPVRASADGSRVSVRGPAGTWLAYDVDTGAEIFRDAGIYSVCLNAEEDATYVVDSDSQAMRIHSDGTAEVLNAGIPVPHGAVTADYSWSDDCHRVLVSCGDTVNLFDLDDASVVPLSGRTEGVNGSSGTLARDGSAAAFASSHTETVDEYDGQLLEDVKLIDLYVARAPDWEPERLVKYVAYQGGYSAGVTYSFGKPAVWPGGDMVATAFNEFFVSTEWGEYGQSQTTKVYGSLLLLDAVSGSVDNLGPMSSSPDFYVEGADVLRLR